MGRRGSSVSEAKSVAELERQEQPEEAFGNFEEEVKQPLPQVVPNEQEEQKQEDLPVQAPAEENKEEDGMNAFGDFGEFPEQDGQPAL